MTSSTDLPNFPFTWRNVISLMQTSGQQVLSIDGWRKVLLLTSRDTTDWRANGGVACCAVGYYTPDFKSCSKDFVDTRRSLRPMGERYEVFPSHFGKWCGSGGLFVPAGRRRRPGGGPVATLALDVMRSDALEMKAMPAVRQRCQIAASDRPTLFSPKLLLESGEERPSGEGADGGVAGMIDRPGAELGLRPKRKAAILEPGATRDTSRLH